MIHQMIKSSAVMGIQLDESSDPEFCEACVKAKIKRLPIPKQRSDARAVKKYGDRIHSDLWGPAQVSSIGGKNYFVTFTDEATAVTEVEFLKKKSKVFPNHRNFVTAAKTQRGVTIKELHSDGGGEYCNEKMVEFLKSQGTKHTKSVHDTPQQDGIPERLNGTIVGNAHAMLFHSQLPKFLWAEAISHAVWLKNRLQMKALDGKTPLEAIGDGKPDLSSLHKFGATMYVRVEAKKLDARGEEARFVGYDKERKGYRMYWPLKRLVTVERNVKFHPDEVLIPVNVQFEGEKAPQVNPAAPNIIKTTEDKDQQDRAPPQPVPQPVEHAPELTRPPDGLSEPKPNTGRGYRARRPAGDYKRMNEGKATVNIMMGDDGDDDEVLEMEDEVFACMMGGDGDEPRTVAEAMKGPNCQEWKVAMRRELEQLERLRTWELVKAPPNANIVGSGFVFKHKRDANGKIATYKARFVAKGYSQVYGIDNFDTFASGVKLTTLWLILTHFARNDWEIHHVDIKNAFVNAEIKETIYIKPPPDYLKPGQEGLVCRLLKGLYGLKQAGREFYIELCRKFVEEMGFSRADCDYAVFLKMDREEPIIVGVSTDDMTIGARHLRTITAFKKDLQKHFEISDMGDVHWLLGIELTRDRESRTIALSQRSYIDSILRDFKMTDCNAVMTLMEKGAVFTHDQCPRTETEQEEMRSRPYMKAIRKIMYLCLVSFPQLSFAMRTLSQFMQTPGKVHWEGIKRVLRYLKGARDLQLVLGGVDEGLEGFSDSDFASQPDRHSISGYAFLYGGGAISWSSKRQLIITLSSTEAEYVVLTHAAKEAIWLQALISEVLHPLPDPTPIFCDNNGAKALAKDDTFHAQTKHIDIRYHFIRE
jgi:hypothetical protein